MNNKYAAVFIFAIAIALVNCWQSLRLSGPSQIVDDLVEDVINNPAQVSGNNSRPFLPTQNVADFPAFMLQWPTDPFDPDECDILDTSIPHVFAITDYPRSYSLDDIFVVENSNLTEAWNQVGGMMNEGNQTSISTNRQTNRHQVQMVACNMEDAWVMWHFPHLMQNLVPCWSLWRHFPDAQHLIVIGKRNRKRFGVKSAYNRGISNLLRAHNISIVRKDDDGLKEESKDTETSRIIVHAKMDLTTGYRAFNGDDVQHLRRSVLSMLGMDHFMERSCGMASSSNEESTSPTGSTANDDPEIEDGSSTHQIRIPRIVLINRKGTRRLKGAHNTSMLLREELRLPYTPPVVFFEGMTFEEQVNTFANSDILLSPHGAQLTSIPFMPRCSSVIEVLPRGYDWNKFFGTLAALSGVNHSYIYLGKNPVKETKRLRSSIRDVGLRDVMLCAPAHPIIEAVKMQVDQWQRCCGFAA